MRRLADHHLGKVAGLSRLKGSKVARRDTVRGGRWTRLASKYKAIHPICERCGHRATVHIHHKIPISIDPSRLYSWQNLQGCCVPCHEAVHEDTPPASIRFGVSMGTAGGSLEISSKSRLPIPGGG